LTYPRRPIWKKQRDLLQTQRPFPERARRNAFQEWLQFVAGP
jgi:hypothetical protein